MHIYIYIPTNIHLLSVFLIEYFCDTASKKIFEFENLNFFIFLNHAQLQRDGPKNIWMGASGHANYICSLRLGLALSLSSTMGLCLSTHVQYYAGHFWSWLSAAVPCDNPTCEVLLTKLTNHSERQARHSLLPYTLKRKEMVCKGFTQNWYNQSKLTRTSQSSNQCYIFSLKDKPAELVCHYSSLSAIYYGLANCGVHSLPHISGFYLEICAFSFIWLLFTKRGFRKRHWV